jgi:hypothetical protein
MSEGHAVAPGGRTGGDAPYHRKLRNYLIDASLQLRFASYLVGLAALLSAFLGWRLWLSYREASRLVALGDPVADDAIAQLMAREDRVRMVWLAAGLVGVVLCLLLFALVVTHRVAGPALVIGRTCRQVGEGRLLRPRPLRHGDLLVELAGDVATMVDRLRTQEETERQLLAEASARIAEGAEGGVKAREILERLAAAKQARLSE